MSGGECSGLSSQAYGNDGGVCLGMSWDGVQMIIWRHEGAEVTV